MSSKQYKSHIYIIFTSYFVNKLLDTGVKTAPD